MKEPAYTPSFSDLLPSRKSSTRRYSDMEVVGLAVERDDYGYATRVFMHRPQICGDLLANRYNSIMREVSHAK